MSVALAPRPSRAVLTTKGRAAAALIRIRDGWESLTVFEQAALAAKLGDLVEAFVRRPRASA